MSLTVEQLTGYVERGLDADLARWFPDGPRVEVPASTRPVAPFLARLPHDAATALAAFDRRVRAGTLPGVLDIADWSYAFDFAANDCRILGSDHETELSDDDVWSIGADGGGNYYVVLTDGRVAVWFHEEEAVEADTQHDSLDVFLWSLVRYHAVRAGVLDLAEVEGDFRALGQPGALAPGLGLLALMSR
ncbi:hypothetical protein [Streptomyces spectabilis]|uniref:SMI1/KNR4 family protein n=1 Tax=Streptomyces spectabilis TaxID=68270 RepID=A0A5P2XG73_STRST|nr:hypothetical protein [Streptomyces spectabilis]MBB5105462.1 hypothetical protein [Streptomyces spectabilis]MCI3906650.1 hypothetical protein [Streptomyces spectabilis]QEV63468.1 hypothetical protein CP982_36165 [Streptomyces spectabilis]GGV21790.1 hypothetical protein GCM10010245_36650 [Streptomyces spectabilis]